MADKNAAAGNCPICQLPIGESKHYCHLCKANGREVRFDSGPCEAEHLTKEHTIEEVEHFDSAKTQTITKP
jgi:predicted amidophosphoribosyltransferase